MLLRVHQFVEREQLIMTCCGSDKPGRVVERHIAAVGDDAIDELELARFERQCAIALVERLNVGIRQFGDHLVEDVVFVRWR